MGVNVNNNNILLDIFRTIYRFQINIIRHL